MDRIKLLNKGDVKTLAQDFKCTPKTVYNHLNGLTNGPLTPTIRKAALERGGYFVPNNTK